MTITGRLPLRDLVEIEVGYAFKSSGFSTDQDDVRLLRGDNIASGCTRWDRPAFWPRDKQVDPRYELRSGDVVLAMDRPWIDAGLKYARIRDHDLPALLVQRVARLRARPGTDQRYIEHVIASQAFTEHVLAVQTGSAIPHISAGQIGDFSIRPHALDEQRAIADVLTALDDKIAANTRLAGRANALAQAIFDHTARETDLRSMNETVTPVLGGTPPRNRAEFWQGDVPWASARDVAGADFGVILGTEERITDLAASETRAKPLPPGSVILTARGTVGAVARLGVASSFNQSCYGFVPGALPPGVLYFSVLSAAERARELAHGSVFDTITTRTFQHLVIPAFRNQQACDLETRITPLLDLVESVARESRALAATRDALLPALMSGRLRVSDAAE